MKKNATGVLVFLAVAATAAIVLGLVPLASCPGCFGRGAMSTPPDKGEDAFWTETCSDCSGRGRSTFLGRWTFLRRMRPCESCDGTGIRAPAGSPRVLTTCSWCDGLGRRSMQRAVQAARYADSHSR